MLSLSQIFPSETNVAAKFPFWYCALQPKYADCKKKRRKKKESLQFLLWHIISMLWSSDLISW